MSNFICEKCGMTNIDCGKQGYKTPREIELEEQNKSLQAELDKEIKNNRKLVKALKEISNVETCTEEYGLSCAEHFYDIAQTVLKEIGEE